MTIARDTTIRPLKQRSVDVLAFVVRRIDETGTAPTLAEIGDAVGFSSLPGAIYHLDRLAAHGLIRRDARISRGITVTPAGRRAVGAHDPASVLASVLDARAAGEPLPPRVVAALEAVA